jgi:hypothetical protein
MVPSGNTVPYILLSANLFLILLHVYILNRIESKLVSIYIYIYIHDSFQTMVLNIARELLENAK